MTGIKVKILGIFLVTLCIQSCGKPSYKYPITCYLKGTASYDIFKFKYTCSYWMTDSFGTDWTLEEDPNWCRQGQVITQPFKTNQ